MANQQISFGLLMIQLTVLWAITAAQSNDCTNVLISMSPCLNYITGNSSTPSAGCCTQLGTVVRSQPQCLCQVLNGGGSNLGLDINQTQALALPRACNVQTPPVSQCQGGSPSGSPSPNGNPGGGSRTGPPSTDASSSSSTTFNVYVMSSLVFLASAFIFH